MRTALALLLLLHASIHAIGFVKAFGYADIPQITQPITRPAGLLWLIVALMFLLAAALLFTRREIWWMPAIPAVLLSQTFIILNWSEAKAGTILNLLILAAAVVAIGKWQFHSVTARELQSFGAGQGATKIVTSQMVDPLPPIVQKWLQHSNVIGKQMIRTVQMRQNGEMRTKPDGRWMHFEAEQHNTIEEPRFLWIANVKMMPLIHLSGRDKLQQGKGHMLIKLLSLFPVADAKGPPIDQGASVRFLAEIVWFPTAALAGYIRWEQMNPTQAKATMNYAGAESSVVFTFTPEGDMESAEALRYYERKEGATLEKWYIRADPAGMREFEGMRVPAVLTVTWKLKEGDFTWLKLRVMDITYNR